MARKLHIWPAKSNFIKVRNSTLLAVKMKLVKNSYTGLQAMTQSAKPTRGSWTSGIWQTGLRIKTKLPCKTVMVLNPIQTWVLWWDNFHTTWLVNVTEIIFHLVTSPFYNSVVIIWLKNNPSYTTSSKHVCSRNLTKIIYISNPYRYKYFLSSKQHQLCPK